MSEDKAQVRLGDGKEGLRSSRRTWRERRCSVLEALLKFSGTTWTPRLHTQWTSLALTTRSKNKIQPQNKIRLPGILCGCLDQESVLVCANPWPHLALQQGEAGRGDQLLSTVAVGSVQLRIIIWLPLRHLSHLLISRKLVFRFRTAHYRPPCLCRGRYQTSM